MTDDFESWLSARAPEETCADGVLCAGTVVGSFRVTALLGCGGFADVYRATDAGGADVALKILRRLDEKTRLRFELESRILAQIRHPNFPSFLGSGSFGERPYVALEFLQPYELPNTDRAVAAFLLPVMSAVEALHRLGYVHRDIKPTNILRRSGGAPVLTDFGLVAPISALRREQSALSVVDGRSVAVGTAGFSAPEQFTGGAAGRAADVHALGALVGACFGTRMPRCWQRICLRATNSNPTVRYQSVSEMRRAVAFRHFRAVAIILCALMGLALLGFLGVSIWRFQRLPPKAAPVVPPFQHTFTNVPDRGSGTNFQYSVTNISIRL